jgi:hypothetical protein
VTLYRPSNGTEGEEFVIVHTRDGAPRIWIDVCLRVRPDGRGRWRVTVFSHWMESAAAVVVDRRQLRRMLRRWRAVRG